VTPVLKEPAQVGWEAWFRKIDLVTPRRLKGRELLQRTRGWWTVDADEIQPVVEQYGRLVVGERGELMVELQSAAQAEALASGLAQRFGDQVLIAP